MTKLHRSGIIAMGVAFAATLISYSFYQPFIPGDVCKAMPVESSFVYHAGSLEELLQSPVCEQINKALGAGNSLRGLLQSNRWTNLTVPSEIAVADLPLRQTGHSKTWAAACWVGWRSPWLRWKLEHAAGQKLKLLYKYSVWSIWQYDSPDIARGMTLTFSLTDNLFLACLSENPTDIVPMLDAYDRAIPQ